MRSAGDPVSLESLLKVGKVESTLAKLGVVESAGPGEDVAVVEDFAGLESDGARAEVVGLRLEILKSAQVVEGGALPGLALDGLAVGVGDEGGIVRPAHELPALDGSGAKDGLDGEVEDPAKDVVILKGAVEEEMAGESDVLHVLALLLLGLGVHDEEVRS